MSARAVCLTLAEQGFRLIGDARDQKGFGKGNRVERIMASCGAFVSILPFRDEESASANEGPYKYLIREMDIATRLDLPTVIVADPRIGRIDGSYNSWLRMEKLQRPTVRPRYRSNSVGSGSSGGNLLHLNMSFVR